MKRILNAMVLFCFMCGIMSLPQVAFAETATDYVDVSADTYVQSGNAGNNFGAVDPIYSVAANNVLSREVFLKFDLSNARAQDYIITKAELSMQLTGPSPQNNQPYAIYYVANDNWTEGAGKGTSGTATGISTDLTWTNSRTMASSATQIFNNGTGRPSLTLGTLTYSDITNAVLNEKDNLLTLRLITTYSASSTYGIKIYSQETTAGDAYKPKLKLTVENDPDKVAVYKDSNALDLGNVANVTGDLTLPKTGSVKGAAITWQSSDSNVLEIIDSGDTYTAKYKTPAANTNVTLTATIVSGAETATKTFDATVGTIQSTELDYNALSVNYDSTQKTISLPSSGLYGSNITWSSSNTAVITNNGNVTRPALTDENVVLTAAISKEGEPTRNKEFPLTVPALGYLLAAKDTCTHITTTGSNSNLSFGNATTINTSNDSSRKALMGFDLSGVNGIVKTATIYLTRADGNINYIDFNYVANDSWEEGSGGTATGNVICGNNYDSLITPGSKVGELRTGGSGSGVKYTFDITGAVQKELAGDKFLSIEFVKSSSYITTALPAGQNTTAYPSSFYTKENPIADYSAANENRIRMAFEFTTDPDEIAIINDLTKIDLPKVAISNISLPQLTDTGLSITWSSTSPSTLATDGSVTIPSVNTSVKLTASVTKNSKTITKDFYVIVKNAQYPFVILNTIYKNASGNLASALVADGSISGVAIDSLTNDAADLYFAVYDGANKLVNVQKGLIPADTIGTITNYPINYIIPADITGYKFKTMIFSNDGNIKPFANYK